MQLVVPETLQVIIKELVGPMIGSAIASTGEGYTRVWENVLIVKQAKDDLVSMVSHLATYPFQIIAMDRIPSLPRSFNGNTELLIFVDLFSGYVIAEASAPRSAQMIAETYEESVLHRFGANKSQADFFKSSTRSWVNANALLWITDPNLMDPQSGWSRLLPELLRCMCRIWINMIGTNTQNDSSSRSTPQEIGSGIQSRNGDPGGEHSQARSRSKKVAISGAKAREQVNRRLREAIADLADTHTPTSNGCWIKSPVVLGSRSTYSIFPVVHISKIKPVRMFPDRSVAHLLESDADRVDFDEALLPEDSWIQDRGPDEYEVDRISDMRDW
ncbi:reverse transcriptase [Phytophthora megakarya]|uniref:Reverse transcriptase n=1 Tax=Phytophthora megakarya TaxID=4795 RepID=A0A225W315_9STRA|nr:reverse transcriptase [Phytophthora megakarya]